MRSIFRYGSHFFAKKNELLQIAKALVGLPGLEPEMTGPESVVLPLHHSPILITKYNAKI